MGNSIDDTQTVFVSIPHADISLYPIPAGADEDAGDDTEARRSVGACSAWPHILAWPPRVRLRDVRRLGGDGKAGWIERFSS